VVGSCEHDNDPLVSVNGGGISWIAQRLLASQGDIICLLVPECSQDSSVGIATDYGLHGQSSIPGRGTRLFSCPQGPDRHWNPPSLLTNRFRRFFPRGKAAGA
jgi:hypothetical protein